MEYSIEYDMENILDKKKWEKKKIKRHEETFLL